MTALDMPSNPDTRGIVEKKTLTIALATRQLWAVAAAAMAILVGAFALGHFAARLETNELTFENLRLKSELDGVIAHSKAELATQRTKAELLTRLNAFLERGSAAEKKRLSDVVCLIWKESQERKISVVQGTMQLPTITESLSPSVRALLISQGISAQDLDSLRRAGSGIVSPTDIARKQNIEKQVQRVVNSTPLVREFEYGDATRVRIPQEVAADVHMRKDCAPG